MHTYIQIWSLQFFSQDYVLAPYTTYAVYLHFTYEWRDLKFKVDSERQISEELFMAILFTRRVFASWEDVGEEIFPFFRFDVWAGIRTWSNKPTYTTY